MTNEEYYEYLDPYITELELCVENTQGLAKTVIGSNLARGCQAPGWKCDKLFRIST